jgi:hypothetical protein
MAHGKYTPGAIPHDCPPNLKAWLAAELQRISTALQHTNHLDVLGAEPSKYEDGLIVYADGTSWNPGSGEGFYGYRDGAWRKLD